MAEDASEVMPCSSEADFTDWYFSDPVTKKSRGKSVFILKGLGEIPARSPSLHLAGDMGQKLRILHLGVTKSTDGGGGRLALDFALDDCPALLEFFKKLDEFLPAVAHQKCEHWFKKRLDLAQITSMYNPMVVVPVVSGRSCPPSSFLRTKINTKGQYAVKVWKVIEVEGGGRGCRAYVQGGIDDICTYDDNDNNATVWATVSVTGMYFFSRRFGCTLTATELFVFPAPKRQCRDLAVVAVDSPRSIEDDDDATPSSPKLAEVIVSG